MIHEFQPITPAIRMTAEYKQKDKFLDSESMYAKDEIDGEPNQIAKNSRILHNLTHLRYATESIALANGQGNPEQLILLKNKLIVDHEAGYK